MIREKDTAAIVAEILKQYNAGVVLDCTYGVGRFYKYYRPRVLVGIDPHIYDEKMYIVRPDILIPKTVWAAKTILEKLGLEYNIVVVDPPFRQRPRGNDKRDYYYNLVGTPEIIIGEAAKLAATLEIPLLLLHFKKTVELEDWKTEKTIEYNYKQGYLYTKSYFIIYKRIRK